MAGRHYLGAACALLILTACGGDDSGPDEVAATEPATTPAPINTRAALEPTPTTAPPPSTSPPSTEPARAAKATASTDATAEAITPTTTTTTTTTVPPDPPPPNAVFADVSLGLELVADVAGPTGVVWHEGSMYISTQPGPVVKMTNGVISTVIDLTDQTFPDQAGSERGILGIEIDPRDGRMFINMTDLDNNTRVISYELADGVAVPESRREVLFIEQPGVGHNGGHLLFDDVGNLFVGSGDGGASNGRDAQDTTKLLGAILRITPKLDGDGYDIPPDNPYADGIADRSEIWARGFRNPWTFNIDDATGDMWIGDIGNNSFEEVSVMRGGESGLNFGWYWFEGFDQRRSNFPDNLIAPVYDYPRTDGVAVMAGFVYRGDEIPALRGAFLFGDLTGPVWAIGAEGVTRLDAEPANTFVGWAQDPDNELYMLSLRNGIYKVVAR